MTMAPTGAGWLPTSETALQEALQGGLLDESHTLELKRTLGTGRSANKELARDLAQFGIDGGTVVFGVDEGSDGEQPILTPVPLHGLAERIEQVARTIPDPPLPVSFTTIESENTEGHGYLLVTVPATGTAPHMVDGVYYGRGDKTKVRLSDAEVLRHHRARRNADEAATELLEAYIARDPVPEDLRTHAHLFVVAAPVVPRREMLLDVVHGPEWFQTFHRLKDAGMKHIPRQMFSPDLDAAGQFGRRADGAALTSYELTPDRRLRSVAEPGGRYEEGAIELELSEDGVIRLMTTRLSDDIDGRESLFAVMIPVLVRRALAVAVAVADHAGYRGPCMLGVGATGLAGLSAHTYGFGSHTPRLGQDNGDYRLTATASYVELRETPGSVCGRLCGRLLRALGQADDYVEYTTD